MTMTSTGKKPARNEPSNLLSDHENEELYKLLGRRCVTLATAVVQVYLAHPDVTKWQKRCTGVCCFVKDNPKRSYFIRVYNIKNASLIWEQELYNQFKYSTPRPYFHTFDTNDYRAGLNFADTDEANCFRNIVNEKINQKHEKRARSRAPGPPSQSNQAQTKPPLMHVQATDIKVNHQEEISYNKKDKKKKEKKKKSGKLTKADIGRPSDFKHVGHVGWDPNKGFDMNEVDPAVKDLFSSAGITETQLQDKDTAKFIYDFIEKRGGVDAVKRERDRPPAPPNRGGQPPPPPPRRDGSHPEHARQGPPAPQRSHLSAPPPPPVRPPSQQQRPQASMPPPPPPQQNGGARMQGGAPPPPPPPGPPPPPTNNMPPPPPPSDGGGRGALLDQIRGGMELRDSSERAAPPPVTGGGRGALLDQIRQGKALKTVSAEPLPEKPEEEDVGLAGALARALQQREKAIHTDSESDSDNGFDDDDDWDD